MVFLVSCAGPKTAVKKPATEPPVSASDKIRVYDPATNSYILVPREAVGVDTVEWEVSPEPPLVTEEDLQKDKQNVGDKEREKEKKEVYDVALLMPFNARSAEIYAERQDPKLIRFIQYYAGVMLATKKLDSLGIPVRIHSYDVGGSATSVASVLQQPALAHADVIIGPYEKSDIESAASFGLTHEVPVISPWLPAFSVAAENPFFIQLYPGLATHAQATMLYIQRAMPDKKVFVVARDNPVEINRTQLFTRHSAGEVEELIIRDASPDLQKTDLHSLLEDQRGTIFILPYYSKSDEVFVNAFMRKLHADKATREAIVFGLPQWIGFSNLNANYMESLSLHLSISAFTDVHHADYASFRNKFLMNYHTIPDQNAFQGYDLMLWLGQTLNQSGVDGFFNPGHISPYGLASGFDLHPVYGDEAEEKPEMSAPKYYENKLIRILKYVDQDFVLVR